MEEREWEVLREFTKPSIKHYIHASFHDDDDDDDEVKRKEVKEEH